MRRKLFNVAAAVSLLLFVTAIPLWVSSLRWEMFLEHTVMPRSGSNWYWRDWHVWSRSGGIHFLSESFLVNNPHFADQIMEKPDHWYRKVQVLGTAGPTDPFPKNLRPFWGFGPFSAGDPMVMSAYNVNVYVPYWCVLAVTLPLPVIWAIWKRRDTRRKNRTLCKHCGYNLTGNTSGICPECGTPVAVKERATT